ncbi:MFS transporter [Siculibacillus lacustris]|nr:MFS transporter [Siculibacillus lacustris]
MTDQTKRPETAAASGDLSLSRLLAFAAPALPIAAFQLPFVIIVPKYYADNVGLSLTLVGALIIAVRLIDAMLDPFIGYFSDHSRPKWGRRRTWFGIAAIPTTIGALMVFRPFPDVDPSNTLFWGGWFFVWSVMMSLGYTALSLSHQSWAAEISTSYYGRNRTFAAREVSVVMGTLVATGLPFVLSRVGLPGDEPVLIGLSLLVGIALPLLAFGTVRFVPEPRHTKHAPTPFMTGIRGMRDNAPFLRLLLAFALSNMANGVPAAILLYFVRDYIHGNEETQRFFLLLYFLAGVLSTPLWLWVSRKTSKHRAWSIAMIVASIAFVWTPFVGFDTLGPWSVWAFGVIMIFAGMAVGADLMLPPSMQSDVIDLDTARTGEQHTGFYFAIWALATKIALSIALGFGFVILGAVGFNKGAVSEPAAVVEQIQTVGPTDVSGIVPVEPGKKIVKKHHTTSETRPIRQSPLALWTLAILYAWVPVVLKLIAVTLVWNFPVGPAEQARLRAEIEANLADERRRNGNGNGAH